MNHREFDQEVFRIPESHITHGFPLEYLHCKSIKHAGGQDFNRPHVIQVAS